jgi:hypothetical protein
MSSEGDCSEACTAEQVSDIAVVDESTPEPVGGDHVTSDSECGQELSVVCNNETQPVINCSETACAENKSDNVDADCEVPAASAASASAGSAECVSQTVSEDTESETPAALTVVTPPAVIGNDDRDSDENILCPPAVPASEQSNQQETTPKARGGRSYQESRRSKKSGTSATAGTSEKSKTSVTGKSERRHSGDAGSSSGSTKSSMSDLEHQGKGDIKQPTVILQKDKDVDVPVDTNIDRRPACDGDSLPTGNKMAEKQDLPSG